MSRNINSFTHWKMSWCIDFKEHPGTLLSTRWLGELTSFQNPCCHRKQQEHIQRKKPTSKLKMATIGHHNANPVAKHIYITKIVALIFSSAGIKPLVASDHLPTSNICILGLGMAKQDMTWAPSLYRVTISPYTYSTSCLKVVDHGSCVCAYIIGRYWLLF